MKFPIRYFLSLTALLALCLGGVWLLHYFFHEMPLPEHGTLMLPVLYIVTFSSHSLVKVAAIWRGKPFVQMVILSMVLRITLYALMALMIIIFSPVDPTADMVYFAIFYLILTIHEIIVVVRNPFPETPLNAGK